MSGRGRTLCYEGAQDSLRTAACVSSLLRRSSRSDRGRLCRRSSSQKLRMGARTFAIGRIFGLAFHRAGQVSSGHGLRNTRARRRSRRPVQIDMEVADLAQTYFTESEARTVRERGPARLRTFLQLWSLKEAALKSIGEGLPFGLDAFEFELDESPRVVDAPGDHGGPEVQCASVRSSGRLGGSDPADSLTVSS